MNIEIIVDDLLCRLRDEGINAQVVYCLNREGGVVSFEIKILGYND